MNIDLLLTEFDAADADRRMSLVDEELGECLDSRVVALLKRTLLDRNEDEFVRVEVLKTLPFRSDTDAECDEFARIVSTLLKDADEDELVRQFSAQTLSRYVGRNGVLPLLEAIVKNDFEDVTVRYNALASIEFNASRLECQENERRCHTSLVGG